MKNKLYDYTQTKDAYEGNRESSVYRDSPLPPKKKPGQDAYNDDNIPETEQGKAQ